MNLKVGYIPFADDDELEQVASTTMVGHNSAHVLDRFSPRYYTKGDSLKHIYNFQQLYLFAHGSEGNRHVSSSKHENCFVDELAKQLCDQRLSMSIAKVKLWVCSGGAGDEQSTAKHLRDAMVAAGFTKVQVYGYTKVLDAGMRNGHKWGSDYDFATKIDRNIQNAKKFRVHF